MRASDPAQSRKKVMADNGPVDLSIQSASRYRQIICNST